MSLLLTGGVAAGYAAVVVGVHRLNVARLRRQAGGFPTVRRLDWDSLLEGVVGAERRTALSEPVTVVPPEGGPTPNVLRGGRAATAQQHECLCALVGGVSVSEQTIVDAGFTGGDAHWLMRLAKLRHAPAELLADLEAITPSTVAEAYLREMLTLSHRVTPISLELTVFASKRRIGVALGRFGEKPALYQARAYASALLGFTGAVLDDLARAVYFSREATFHARAVTDMPFIEEARPALWKACEQTLAQVAD